MAETRRLVLVHVLSRLPAVLQTSRSGQQQNRDCEGSGESGLRAERGEEHVPEQTNTQERDKGSTTIGPSR